VSPQAAAMNQQGMMNQPPVGSKADAKKGDSKKGSLAANVGTGPSTVVAMIKEAKANQLALTVVGGSAVTVDVAPNAAVKGNTNDAHFAQRGDKIDVNGYSTQPPKVIAENVRITITRHSDPDKAKPAGKTPEKGNTASN